MLHAADCNIWLAVRWLGLSSGNVDWRLRIFGFTPKA